MSIVAGHVWSAEWDDELQGSFGQLLLLRSQYGLADWATVESFQVPRAKRDFSVWSWTLKAINIINTKISLLSKFSQSGLVLGSDGKKLWEYKSEERADFDEVKTGFKELQHW